MSFINQYSLALTALLVLAICAVFLLRDGYQRRDGFVLAGLALLLGALWWGIRPQATPITDPDKLQAQIGTGTPVLLEFQSPY